MLILGADWPKHNVDIILIFFIYLFIFFFFTFAKTQHFNNNNWERKLPNFTEHLKNIHLKLKKFA